MSPLKFSSWLPIAVVPVILTLIVAWLLLLFSGRHKGGEPLWKENGSSVTYLPDAGGNLTIDEVAKLPLSSWLQQKSTDFFVGRQLSSLWVRAVLKNPGPDPIHGILENEDFFMDKIVAWILENGKMTALISGDGQPAEIKQLPGREAAFAITLPPQSEQVVFLNLTDYRSVYARLIWWPQAAKFHLVVNRAGIAEGVYFGGLIALLGYNALLWMRLRQADIGYYVLYLIAIGLFAFLARAGPGALGWKLGSPGLEWWLVIAMAASGLFLTLFAGELLETRRVLPNAHRWVKGWTLFLLSLTLAVTISPLSWAGPWMRYAVISIALTHVGLLVLAIAAWRAGVWQARFFVLSFGFLFAGSFTLVGVWFLDSSMREVGMRGLLIGSALEMSVLSLAVADRFVRTQRSLLDEIEQRRMIEETYSDELEEEVRERTRELSVANVDKDRILAVIGHDLRGPLTGLMMSAAHGGSPPQDVQRTCRALLLTIEDLVLWSRMHAGERSTSCHRATGLIAPAIALHQALAEQEGICLRVEVPEELVVETDLVLAQTLVRNLLENALKFARTEVLIRAQASGEGVRVSVGNNGPALQPDVAARIAHGEDEPMTTNGGLGLKLCREICGVLGMTLEVHQSNGSTEFYFTFHPCDQKTVDNPS